MNAYDLRDYLDYSDMDKAWAELRRLASDMGVRDFTALETIYADIVRLFNGRFPGFRASNTKYHNLEHTCAVTLAVVRLFHGLWVEGNAFEARYIVLGIIAALFHDTGLIQTESDTEGTGAKYTRGHEQRSIQLVRSYLPSLGFSETDIKDCSDIILYTVLSGPVPEASPGRDYIVMAGKILGSADLLAQMADRLYLEKLPLLFMEFREAGLPHFTTELDLLIATDDFYESVFKKRIYNDMDGIAGALRSHFRVRWNIDKDMYMESVEKNVGYLHSLKETCNDSYQCYLKQLRRGNIIKDLYGKDYC